MWTFTNERPVDLRISRGGQSRPHRRVLVDADSGSGCGRSLLRKAIRTHGLPEKITIDQSGSSTAAIQRHNRNHNTGIAIPQCKYLNNIVERDHRAVKRMTRPMLGGKSLWAAGCTIASIEVRHVICQELLVTIGAESHTSPELCYALAA